MRLKIEQLEDRTLLAVDIQVLHDPISPAQPGDEVTRMIRVFGDSFDGEIQVSSSLSAQLENVRWERTDGFAKQEQQNPYLGREPDFQIAAGRTRIWFQSIDTTGDPLGDLNGDGAQDFLFFNATTDWRESVVVFGPLESDLDLGELADDGSEGFKLEANVKPLGDVNGDGFDDIGLGNEIIFGASDLHAQTPALTITDAWQFESTGDINGDGFDDLLAVGTDDYLIFGRERFADLSTATADTLASDPNGVLSLGEFVSTASPAGDLNNDGLDDVVFGRWTPQIGLLPFVLYGDIDFPKNIVNFDALDGTNGFAIGNPLGVSLSQYYINGTQWSWRISGTSDVNGDSVDDLVIAYNGGGDCETCTAVDKDNIDVDGGVFVLHGGANIASGGEFRSELDSHSTIRQATSYSDRLGRRLNAHVLDMNSDGQADIHVTAGAWDVSKNFVFFGDADPSHFDLGHVVYPYEGFNGEDGHQYNGDLRFFDVDGDGIDDALLEVLVDQPNRSDGGPDHRVDVFLGKPFTPAPVIQGSGDVDEIVELDGNSSVIYTVTGTLKDNADSITTVAMPVDQVDVDLRNNLASDRNGVSITVNSSEPMISNNDVELQINVTNLGPSNATSVTFFESITASLEEVTWTRSTQLFPASFSLLELPSGLGATLKAPEIVRTNERCGCPTEALNQYLGRPIHEQLGSDVGSLGDVDGDGFDDIFLSDDNSQQATPRYWQFNGSADFGMDGTFPNSTSTIAKPETAPIMVDVNGDGFEDKLVASAQTDRRGQVHVLYGNATNAFPDPSELNGANGFTIVGFTRSTYVSSAASGDVNGDGFDDVIVAEGKDQFIQSEPRIHVVFGGATDQSPEFDLGDVNGTNGFQMETHVPEDNIRDIRVASDFDINGDGLDDILIGSPSIGAYVDDIGSRKSGEAYLIFGRSASAATGTGAIEETIDVPVETEIVYTVRGVLPADSEGVLSGLIEAVPSSNQIELSPSTNIIRYSTIPVLTADINGDERVDFADFLVLSTNFGRAEDVQRNDGDLNGDSVVDFADFLILSKQFGQRK